MWQTSQSLIEGQPHGPHLYMEGMEVGDKLDPSKAQ